MKLLSILFTSLIAILLGCRSNINEQDCSSCRCKKSTYFIVENRSFFKKDGLILNSNKNLFFYENRHKIIRFTDCSGNAEYLELDSLFHISVMGYYSPQNRKRERANSIDPFSGSIKNEKFIGIHLVKSGNWKYFDDVGTYIRNDYYENDSLVRSSIPCPLPKY